VDKLEGIKMIDFVKQLELNNYLDESQDELAIKLDELISKGEYK
jgi:hypothetical protein